MVNLTDYNFDYQEDENASYYSCYQWIQDHNTSHSKGNLPKDLELEWAEHCIAPQRYRFFPFIL